MKRPESARVRGGLRLGCALPLLLLLALCAYGVFWWVTPGRQLAAVDLLAAGERAPLAYLYLPDLEATPDDGAAALLQRLAAEALRVGAVLAEREAAAGEASGRLPRLLSAERLTETLRGWSEDPDAAATLAHLAVPRELTVRWESGSEPVIAANFRRYLRPLRAFAPRIAALEPDLEWRDDLTPLPCLRVRDSGWVVATLDGTLLAAPRPELLSAALEDLLAASGAGVAAEGAGADPAAAGPGRRRLALRDAADWHLHGRIDPAAVPAGTPLDPFLSRHLLTGIFIGARALSADALEMQVALDTSGAAAARALRPAATLLLRMAVGQGRLQGLEITRRERVENARIIHDLEIRGLDRALRVWADSYLEARRH